MVIFIVELEHTISSENMSTTPKDFHLTRLLSQRAAWSSLPRERQFLKLAKQSISCVFSLSMSITVRFRYTRRCNVLVVPFLMRGKLNILIIRTFMLGRL